MMVIGGPTFHRIAQKLEDNALMDLEFDPTIDSHMGGNCHQHHERDNKL